MAPKRRANQVIEVPPSSTASIKSKAAASKSSSEHIVVQLPLAKSKVEELIKGTDGNELEGSDPSPYTPNKQYESLPDTYDGKAGSKVQTKSAVCNSDNHANGGICCFWCCHPATTVTGMPLRYDVVHDNFDLFGSFCSLECTAAYNFSVHNGSDRAWEIYGWIQILGRRMGCSVIRPAPNRYLLEMFGGPLAINDFRNIHSTGNRTAVMNMPPFINLMPQMEMMNTSYLTTEPGIGFMNKVHVVPEKQAARREKTVVDFQKTLDSKMNLNLSYESASVSTGA